MLIRKLLILPFASLFVCQLGMAGQSKPETPVEPENPGQEENPGQQEGQPETPQKPTKPGQEEGCPGQGQEKPENPGQQVYSYPQYGVQLAVTSYQHNQFVYVYKFMNQSGTLARLGLHNGDVIYSIAQQKTQTPQQVQQMMKRLEQQRQSAGHPVAVNLTIARGGQWYSWQATLN